MRKFRRMLELVAKIANIGNFGCHIWDLISDSL